VVTLREIRIEIAPGAVAEASVPTAALSLAKSAAKREFVIEPETMPKLQPLLDLLLKRDDIPRSTSQLAVLAIVADVTFADWVKWEQAGSESTLPNPSHIATAVDAIGLLKQASIKPVPALVTDPSLKLLALRTPLCRAKAMQLYGIVLPDDAGAGGVSPPNINQLLHTKPGDNCPVCRMRQQMDRSNGDL
jgi:hypothetical protein